MPDPLTEQDVSILLDEYRMLERRLVMYADRSFKVLGAFGVGALGLLGYAFLPNADRGMAAMLALIMVNGACFSIMHSQLIQLSVRRTLRWIARRVNRDGIAPLLVWEEYVWPMYYGQRKGRLAFKEADMTHEECPCESNWSPLMGATVAGLLFLIGIAEVVLWLGAVRFLTGLVGRFAWIIWVLVAVTAAAYCGLVYGVVHGITTADRTTKWLPPAADHQAAVVQNAGTLAAPRCVTRTTTTTTTTTRRTDAE